MTNELDNFLNYKDTDEEAIRASKAQAAHSADQVSTNYKEVRRSLNDRNSIEKNKFTENLIDENIKLLRQKYPTGGLLSSQVVTSEILLTADESFFKKYEKEVEEGSKWVREALTDRNLSTVVGGAVSNPGNIIYQEQAFNTVNTLTLEYLGKKPWSNLEKAIIRNLISNEIIGLSILEPLFLDKRITEIICNGPYDIQVEIKGRLLRVPSAKFRNTEHIYLLLEKIYQAKGKQLSRMTALLKTSMSGNNRVYASDISVASGGPNVNIRRHSESFWTPEDIIKLGSANEEIMTLLGNLIYKGCSFVVVGGMSTGKTSMLNALTGFYRNDARIVTLEDSLELRPNPKKMLARPMECVPARPDKEHDKGVTMRDLVQASTQMAPKVIIVGEVTDGAAYDLCQALNAGHSGASTFHANTPREAMPRLKSLIGQGEIISAEAALPLISAAFNIIIYLSHSLIDGSRRISSIVEIPSYPTFPENGEPYLDTRILYEFVTTNTENNKVEGFWEKKADISDNLIARKGLDLEQDLTWEQLKELSRVD